EPTGGIFLGTAVQHALEGSGLCMTMGPPDGHSCSGTHQNPSLTPPASMKQGPFPPDRLCCPVHRRYYDPLRLPLGRSPFPGVTGYRRACFPDPQTRGRGGSLQFPGQPSDRSTPHTPGGSWAPAPGSLVPSVAFAVKVPTRL